MQKNANVVEDALFQIKNLEEALQENAKGILHSTMKEEIKQLVKESLNEQEDDEIEDLPVGDETGAPVDDVTVTDDEFMMGDDESMMGDEDETDDETIDLTAASDSEVLRVFKAMGDEDGIIVKKEDGMINLKDGEDEYMIQLGESDKDRMVDDSDFYELDLDNSIEGELEEFDLMGAVKGGLGLDEEDGDDGFVFEIVMDDKSEFSEESESSDPYSSKNLGLEEDSWKDEEHEGFEDLDIFMGSDDREGYEGSELDEETFDDMLKEAIKKTIKAKGVGIGSGPKFKYGKTTDYPTKKQKSAFGKDSVKAKGTGKPRFEYDEEVNDEGFKAMKSEKKEGVKKMETKEASRTNSYPNANKVGNRKGSNQNINRTQVRVRPNNRVNEEVEVLREKNEEYRKALDVFRTKLNEVAVFNSNLAYATRLFTEHSTTKQEKINILRRFDSVENLKESKNLYRTIKEELGSPSKGNEQSINESIDRNVNRTVSTGSAVNLIESKTYENPQFLRIKDLMGKLK